LAGVREAARKSRDLKFTALLHHVDEDLLTWSFYQLKKDAALGVDQTTWHEYEEDLENRIADLHGRVHRGGFRATPSRRVYIPKPDGRRRPLGIASLEDKIVQHAVRTVLQCIYEQDFLGFSYGFRPGRSQHQALDALAYAIYEKRVNWILDADIQGFFDEIDRDWLVKFLEHRIGDRRILRLIRKWLNAGIIEDADWSDTGKGAPQGAVLSPLLSNVFLHYVLDLWINQWRNRHCKGKCIVIRYADDFVIGFECETDAKACREALHKRLQQFGLTLHPQKTRLIEFGRASAARRQREGRGRCETFDFLGFTHICGKTRKNNRFAVWRRTSAKRMSRTLTGDQSATSSSPTRLGRDDRTMVGKRSSRMAAVSCDPRQHAPA
jgi:group II intron reverse transcriptase/maturase